MFYFFLYRLHQPDGRRGGGTDEVTSKSLQITAPFQIRIQKAVSSLAP